MRKLVAIFIVLIILLARESLGFLLSSSSLILLISVTIIHDHQ